MISLMKKFIAATAAGVGYLISSGVSFAQEIQVQPPILNGKKVGYSDINDFINKAIVLVFIVAVIGVLVMLIVGAVRWIFSGGNKESVASARGMIIHALIGLAILAVAFALAR